MSQAIAALDALWKVLLVGLVLGAGLPALFSLGVRRQSEGHKAQGGVAFVIVGAAVVAGIVGIVAHGLGVKLL